ncbi:MAG: helix-turn-helix domain-containing protein [Hyphomicrobiaceae bacterium]
MMHPSLPPVGGRPSVLPQSSCLADRVLRDVVEEMVARVFFIGRGELECATRGPATAAFARQVAMYLVHITFGLSLTEVGRAFGRDRTTVAHACSIVEDRRDDPVLDRALELLESAARLLVAAAMAQPRRAGW